MCGVVVWSISANGNKRNVWGRGTFLWLTERKGNVKPVCPLTKMRLITHNMLQCHVKNCNTNNFPLRFEDVQLDLIEADYNPEFLVNMLPKIEWEALVNTALQVSCWFDFVFNYRLTCNIILLAWYLQSPCTTSRECF